MTSASFFVKQNLNKLAQYAMQICTTHAIDGTPSFSSFSVIDASPEEKFWSSEIVVNKLN